MTITSQKTTLRHNTVQGACSILSSGSHALWRFIPLSQGQFAIVDADNYEWLNQWKWYATIGGNTFYATRTTGKREAYCRIYMHREILNVPKGMQTDHINHNGLDNRECNIRICTNVENQYNRKKQKNSTSSFYKGITWHKRVKKWQSRIKQNGKYIFIGYFDNEIKAAKAYDTKALELHGEFAYTNF